MPGIHPTTQASIPKAQVFCVFFSDMVAHLHQTHGVGSKEVIGAHKDVI